MQRYNFFSDKLGGASANRASSFALGWRKLGKRFTTVVAVFRIARLVVDGTHYILHSEPPLGMFLIPKIEN